MKRLGDWRLPLIFAVPVLLWTVLLWSIFQSVPSARATEASATTPEGRSTALLIASPTDVLTTAAPVIAPVYPTAIPCSNAATITAFHATTTVEQGNVVIRVTDQNGRPVSCAWAMPKGGNHAVGGETDTTGTVVFPLAELPVDDYFFGVIQMKGTPATTAYSFSR